MRHESCEKFLLNWINNNEGFHKKVDLYKVAEEWSPETAGRKLRKLSGKGIDKKTGKPYPKLIEVAYYDGKYARGLAKYARLNTKTNTSNPRIQVVEINGERRAVMI